MHEDAWCNNPCGAEPMGCRTCDLVTGGDPHDHYYDHEYEQYREDDFDDEDDED